MTEKGLFPQGESTLQQPCRSYAWDKSTWHTYVVTDAAAQRLKDSSRDYTERCSKCGLMRTVEFV